MSMVMGMQNFIKIYQKVQGIGPVSLFSEFEPRQNLDLSQISFDNLIGYILSISMYMQNFITISFTVLEIGPFSLFQNLELGKDSTDTKCQFVISWARSCQGDNVHFFHLDQSQMSFDNLMGYILSIYQCVCKISSQHSSQFKKEGRFHFFRIRSSAKSRPMKNVISQSLGLDLVNINVYATFYQSIPLSLHHGNLSV